MRKVARVWSKVEIGVVCTVQKYQCVKSIRSKGLQRLRRNAKGSVSLISLLSTVTSMSAPLLRSRNLASRLPGFAGAMTILVAVS